MDLKAKLAEMIARDATNGVTYEAALKGVLRDVMHGESDAAKAVRAELLAAAARVR